MRARLRAGGGLLWVLCAVAIAVGFLLPSVLPVYWLSVATLVYVFCVFATSINLIAGYGGMITLGQAGIFGAAGYAVAYVSTRLNDGFVLQIVAGMGVAIGLAAVFGAMAVRTSGVYFLMVTLAQGMVVWGLTYSLSTYTGGDSGLPGVRRPTVVQTPDSFYYLCLTVVVLLLAGTALLVRSPFGLGLRAIRANEGRARAVGYNTTLHRFLAFLVSGCIAGVGGILYVYFEQFISPDAAYFRTSADGTVMALVGGLGTTVGPLVGALIVVLIKNVLSNHVARWPTVEGVLFILIVLYARQGIVGVALDWWNRLRNRRASVRGRADTSAAPLAPDASSTPVPALASGTARSALDHAREEDDL